MIFHISRYFIYLHAVMKYQALTVSIESCAERKDVKGKDTFNYSDWWKSNCVTLPRFRCVLCTVLTNAPNSLH
jgi:hypothetical protein